jgi:hypothetical protein
MPFPAKGESWFFPVSKTDEVLHRGEQAQTLVVVEVTSSGSKAHPASRQSKWFG